MILAYLMLIAIRLFKNKLASSEEVMKLLITDRGRYCLGGDQIMFKWILLSKWTPISNFPPGLIYWNNNRIHKVTFKKCVFVPMVFPYYRIKMKSEVAKHLVLQLFLPSFIWIWILTFSEENSALQMFCLASIKFFISALNSGELQFVQGDPKKCPTAFCR